MKAKFVFIFLALAAFSPLSSACGEHEEEIGYGLMNFGFVGGIIPILVAVALILAIVLLGRKLRE